MKNPIKQFIVYSTPMCVYCKHLKSWLVEKKVPFKEIDIAANPAEGQKMIQKTGQMVVPISIILFPDNHEEIVIGFDQAKITQLLGL